MTINHFALNHFALSVFRAQRGITLVETAIVLMVVAMIMGGVWLYVGNSRDAQLLSVAKSQHQMLVQRVRDFYKSSASAVIPSGENAVRNAALVQNNAVPAEMVRAEATAGTLDHAWGPRRPNDQGMSTVPSGLLSWTDMGNSGVVVFVNPTNSVGGSLPVCTSPCFYFGIHYRGLPTEACTRLVTQLATGPSADGLTYLEINRNSSRPVVNVNDTGFVAPTVPQIDNMCRTGSVSGGVGSYIDTGADLTFIYRLRASTS